MVFVRAETNNGNVSAELRCMAPRLGSMGIERLVTGSVERHPGGSSTFNLKLQLACLPRDLLLDPVAAGPLSAMFLGSLVNIWMQLWNSLAARPESKLKPTLGI